MKKLMENWRSYEKDVLNEQRTKKSTDQILAEMPADQTIPYIPPNYLRPPTDTETAIFDAANTGIGHVADFGSTLAGLYDDYIQDPFSNTVHKMTGPLQDALEPLIRYGLPDADFLRNLTDEQLEVAGMTREDAEDLARLEYTDFIFDPEDPIDMTAASISGGSAALGAGAASTGVGASTGAVVAGGGQSLAAMTLLVGRLNKLRKVPGWVSDVLKIARFKKLNKSYDALQATKKAGVGFVANKGVINGYQIGDITITAEKTVGVIPKAADLVATNRKAIPFTPFPGEPVQYLIFKTDDYDTIIKAAPEMSHIANLTDPGMIERVTAGLATGDISLKDLAKGTSAAVAKVPGKVVGSVANYCKSGKWKGGSCVVAGAIITTAAALDVLDTIEDTGTANQELEDARDAENPNYDGPPLAPPPSPAGTEVQTFDTDTDEKEIEEEIDVKRKANEDIIREEIIKYFSNRR
jgi:hypothetical protein